MEQRGGEEGEGRTLEASYSSDWRPGLAARRPPGLGWARDRGTGPPPWTGTRWLFSRWRLDVECLGRDQTETLML